MSTNLTLFPTEIDATNEELGELKLAVEEFSLSNPRADVPYIPLECMLKAHFHQHNLSCHSFLLLTHDKQVASPVFCSLICIKYNTRKQKSGKKGKVWEHSSHELRHVDMRWT